MSLVDSHAVAALVEHVCSGKAGGTASDDGHLFSGPHTRRAGRGVAFFIGVLNDGVFVLLRGYRVSVQAAGTGRLAERGADAGGELRKVVGFFQAFIGLLPVAGIHQIVPFRHQIVQRAAGGHSRDHLAVLAERDAAFHAARALKLLLFQGEVLMKFIEMSDPLLRSFGKARFSLIFHKSCGFSHIFLTFLPLKRH